MSLSSRPLLMPDEVTFFHAGAEFISINPFGPAWVAAEQIILGGQREGGDRLISLVGQPGPLTNMKRVIQRLRPVLEKVWELLRAGVVGTPEELAAYRNVAIYFLYDSVDLELQKVADTGVLARGVYGKLVQAYERLFRVPGVTLDVPAPDHLFALFYQARRAFHCIYNMILGTSGPSARLREDTWALNFTGDMSRYASWNFERMDNESTLIVGPTGTGKELVARSLGLTRYLPFDKATETFPRLPDDGFVKVNISAIPPELATSQLFGHARGTFTGAVKDTDGLLSQCKQHGTLFLDEIGNIDPMVQITLLRVMEEWQYTRMGDTRQQDLAVKVIAAAQPELLRNEDLRDDFYYRVAENVIHVPSLRERIDDDPDELRVLVRAFALKKAGPLHADALTEKVLERIAAELSRHPWPGNVRELRGCVSNMMSLGRFLPREAVAAGPAARRRPAPEREAAAGLDGALDNVLDEVLRGELTAEGLVHRAAASVFERTRSFTETGRLLRLDPRTVRRMLRPPRSRRSPGRSEHPRGARSVEQRETER